ncbi:MAG TPA: FAD-dependent monooxygenase, partial [Gemmatimonadales bacterium]|nr:FAD-dependent monooxygenase [Gemmatimonadales bacterium]
VTRGSTSVDVIVVGAGPAGSTLAFRLAQLGLHVSLLDRARFPRDKPCAEYLNHGATRILGDMGVVSRLMSAGAVSLSGMNIRSPNGTWIRGEFVGKVAGRVVGHALSLRRVVLDEILVELAKSAGVDVQEHAHVTDVIRDSSGRVTGVRVRDRQGGSRDLNALLVVAADGLNSTVARRLSLTRRSRLLRRVAFVGHFTGVSGIGSAGEMHVERNGFMGLAHVGGGESTAALVVPQERAREASGNVDAFFHDWINRCEQLAPRYAGARLTGRVRAVGPFASHARRAWVPGAALVGDAAEYLDPFTGEGIWSALRGAELLAPWANEAARAAEAGNVRDADAPLKRYASARHAEFRGRRALERVIATVVARPALMNRAAEWLAAAPEDANLLVAVTGAELPAGRVFGLLSRGG